MTSARDRRRLRNEHHDRLERLNRLLYEHDPYLMGSSVHAPDDEYMRIARQLMPLLSRARTRESCAEILLDHEVTDPGTVADIWAIFAPLEGGRYDISRLLLAAQQRAAGWTPAAVMELTRRYGGRLRTDWDDGAGESWIRLIADDEVVAYVSVRVPLCVVVESRTRLGKRGEVERIAVPDLDEPILVAREEALHAAFGEAGRHPSLRDAFSAHDLWFATV